MIYWQNEISARWNEERFHFFARGLILMGYEQLSVGMVLSCVEARFNSTNVLLNKRWIWTIPILQSVAFFGTGGTRVILSQLQMSLPLLDLEQISSAAGWTFHGCPRLHSTKGAVTLGPELKLVGNSCNSWVTRLTHEELGVTRRVMRCVVGNSGRFQTCLKFPPSYLAVWNSWGTPNQFILLCNFLESRSLLLGGGNLGLMWPGLKLGWNLGLTLKFPPLGNVYRMGLALLFKCLSCMCHGSRHLMLLSCIQFSSQLFMWSHELDSFQCFSYYIQMVGNICVFGFQGDAYWGYGIVPSLIWSTHLI